MISFTGKPGLNISGLSFPQWDASKFTSWITTVLVPWINRRSGLVLISSTEVTSAVSSVDFTEGFSSDFDAYLFIASDWQSDTDNVAMHMRIFESGAIEDDASDYRHSRFASADGGAISEVGSTGDTEIDLGAALGNASGESMSLIGMLTTPSGSTFKKLILMSVYNNTSGEVVTGVTGGQYDGSTNSIDGIRFFQSSNNIDGGTFHLFGVRM